MANIANTEATQRTLLQPRSAQLMSGPEAGLTHVDVDGRDEREQHQRQRPHELVNVPGKQADPVRTNEQPIEDD